MFLQQVFQNVEPFLANLYFLIKTLGMCTQWPQNVENIFYTHIVNPFLILKNLNIALPAVQMLVTQLSLVNQSSYFYSQLPKKYLQD